MTLVFRREGLGLGLDMRVAELIGVEGRDAIENVGMGKASRVSGPDFECVSEVSLLEGAY